MDKFWRENKFLFLNLRLTYYNDNDSNIHKDLWRNFFYEVLKIVIKTNRLHKLKVYQIFYSPERSIQEDHKIRNLLHENKEKLRFSTLNLWGSCAMNSRRNMSHP